MFWTLRTCLLATAILNVTYALQMRDNSVQFVVPPVKDSKAGPECAHCIEMHVTCLIPSPDMVFTFNVESVLPYKVDSSRFGGTSGVRGKQSLNMVVQELPSMRGLREKRGMHDGSNILLLRQSYANRTMSYRICFENVVFDGSWSSIDTSKRVAIEARSAADDRRSLEQYLAQEELPGDALANLNATITNLNITLHLSPTLRSLERRKRDLNEGSFSWLLYHLAALALVETTSQLAITYYILRKCRGRLETASHTKSLG